MRKFYNRARKLAGGVVRDDSGAALVEYGLLVALVSLAAIGTLTTVGTDIGTLFTGIGTKLTGAVPGP